MRLTPDNSKMVLSTAGGYIMVIHNLDLTTLNQDLSDWPVGNEAEVVSSLHVHPQGWCVVSRNTSNVDKSEWTCVHDIQDISLDSPIISRKRTRVENEEIQPTTSYPVSSSSSSSSSDQSDEDVHHSRVSNINIAPGPQV
jgi:WD repeat-containing protein 32